MSFERLIAEHDNIEALAVVFRHAVDRPVPMMAQVLAARARLSAELSEHLALEDVDLYPRLINGDSNRLTQAAAEFVDAFETLRDDWQAYLQEWSTDCILADWASFRAETMTMLDRLHRRVQRENELLYPLALHLGVIRLRA